MNLPPLIQIAIEEQLWNCRSPRQLREIMVAQGLGDEFSRQARWSIDEFDYAESGGTPDGFAVTPAGSLNPFSTVGKCLGEKCTAETTNDFIKTVGLYTEFTVLPDPISPYFLEGSQLRDLGYLHFFRQLQILEKVASFIES